MAEPMDDWQHLDGGQAAARAQQASLAELLAAAAAVRDAGHGVVVSYSRKVFIPLTELCRDVCHYCTYAKTPRRLKSAYLEPDAVLAIAQAGKAQGCREALFTLGDKPELRYSAAREALARLGHATTLDYVHAMAARVLAETGLLPHLNPGVLGAEDYRRLRPVAPSMGLMLESASERLGMRGGPHFGSPDKQPAVRLKAIDDAGAAGVALTSGLLIGIGETRGERIDSLVALRESHRRHGHLQELIIQNFVPKPGTKMAGAPAPAFEELLWTIAVARLLFGPAMNIQAPPNLNEGRLGELVGAGINDWGGVSPVTPDHVNPESPWPQVAELARQTAAAGKLLVERLTLYPAYVRERARWLDAGLEAPLLLHADAQGHARSDDWSAGSGGAVPLAAGTASGGFSDRAIGAAAARAAAGERLGEREVERLFEARGDDVERLCAAADALRAAVNGDTVSYVVNRNINYTNLCSYKCQFCAFAKGKADEDLRGAPYVLDLDEIARRAAEAWERGATEVCLQGGIHPAFTGQTYLDILRRVKAVVPGMHVHAFSPLEVSQGARTLGIGLEDFLRELKASGLGTLPGTAAEILDDEVRRQICPDKLGTAEWLEVVATAHHVGLRTTSTIMFGHLEAPVHWARHLLAIRDLQQRSGGLTEFVPLPFVHMEAPLFRRGRARPGPSWREVRLMHAIARLVLHPLVTNIQASWAKLGAEGAAQLLAAGVNDLGGTLMNESISRAAGATYGQELPPERMDALIRAAGREPRQRTTLYGEPPAERVTHSYGAADLAAMHFRPAREYRGAPRSQPASTVNP
ncbi:MAG: 5-amino-6-(D-ribitylamino)uracil--L-tyrosine 4-hydroxyphenyl transferase CofH [Gammaproteobacteria bacterium]|nr:5-amino-6-(D-ribitylamino)uracil--L-tyrosine 4-hydroxyphenyl transferase CofH [Gammaproteobacteria bacterium]